MVSEVWGVVNDVCASLIILTQALVAWPVFEPDMLLKAGVIAS